MPSLPESILSAVLQTPGLTDREIANRLQGPKAPQQPINQAARALEAKGRLVRSRRPDGLLGNYPSKTSIPDSPIIASRAKNHDVDALSEDEIKKALDDWLKAQGWKNEIVWGTTRGIDIEAKRGNERWVIEVKGPGSRQPMRVNYFLSILGETLQRMHDPRARYSIALPDLKQYRGLWERLPTLAKSRTTISLLLVTKTGGVEVLE